MWYILILFGDHSENIQLKQQNKQAKRQSAQMFALHYEDVASRVAAKAEVFVCEYDFWLFCCFFCFDNLNICATTLFLQYLCMFILFFFVVVSWRFRDMRFLQFWQIAFDALFTASYCCFVFIDSRPFGHRARVSVADDVLLCLQLLIVAVVVFAFNLSLLATCYACCWAIFVIIQHQAYTVVDNQLAVVICCCCWLFYCIFIGLLFI